MHLGLDSRCGAFEAKSDASVRQGSTICEAIFVCHKIYMPIHTGDASALYLALRKRIPCSCKLEARKAQSSKRQAKDPNKYGSMDDMRAHLQQQRKGSGGLAGFLNWLSNSAFGSRLCGAFFKTSWLHASNMFMKVADTTAMPACHRSPTVAVKELGQGLRI